jgi:hypothetical protein
MLNSPGAVPPNLHQGRQPIRVPAVLVKIDRTLAQDIGLQDAALGWWRMGHKRDNVQYVFAVSQGCVVEVFEVNSRCRRQEFGDHGWPPPTRASRPRNGWDKGTRHPGLTNQYRGMPVAHLYGGSSNPVRYQNC